MDFLKKYLKDSKNEYATFASEGISAGDVESYIDTGSYMFNAVITGSIYGGIPSNKVTALAGLEGTGKTFYSLSIVRNFLNSNPESRVVYFESESAISKDMIESRGIDPSRVVVWPVATVEEFRTAAFNLVDRYMTEPKETRQPIMLVLDSLGNLSTEKEIDNVAKENNVADMKRTQLIKAAFRVLTLKLGKANIPLLVTNHIYTNVGGYGDPYEMAGGGGLKYCASTIAFLSKSKEKDGSDQVGNIIKCRARKSRFTIENSIVETRLFFDNRGLDRYYGLVDVALEGGVWQKSGNQVVINDKKYFAKTIYADPEKFFTPEVLDELDKVTQRLYKYGTSGEN